MFSVPFQSFPTTAADVTFSRDLGMFYTCARCVTSGAVDCRELSQTDDEIVGGLYLFAVLRGWLVGPRVVRMNSFAKAGDRAAQRKFCRCQQNGRKTMHERRRAARRNGASSRPSRRMTIRCRYMKSAAGFARPPPLIPPLMCVCMCAACVRMCKA